MAVLAHNLDIIRKSIWDKYGKITIGWIGDQAHQSGRSDHNPDGDGVVHAIDVMFHDKRAETVVKASIGRPDLEYVIYKQTIWTRSNDWRPEQYGGAYHSHVHISGRHDSTSERTNKPLQFGDSEEWLDDMAGLDDDVIPNLYKDKAKNPRVTIKTALAAATGADQKASEALELVKKIAAKLGVK